MSPRAKKYALLYFISLVIWRMLNFWVITQRTDASIFMHGRLGNGGPVSVPPSNLGGIRPQGKAPFTFRIEVAQIYFPKPPPATETQWLSKRCCFPPLLRYPPPPTLSPAADLEGATRFQVGIYINLLGIVCWVLEANIVLLSLDPTNLVVLKTSCNSRCNRIHSSQGHKLY